MRGHGKLILASVLTSVSTLLILRVVYPPSPALQEMDVRDALHHFMSGKTPNSRGEACLFRLLTAYPATDIHDNNKSIQECVNDTISLVINKKMAHPSLTIVLASQADVLETFRALAALAEASMALPMQIRV